MNRNRVGNLLEAARLRAGLKQKELADKIGVKQNMISDYERGKRRLSKQMAARIADVLHLPTERISCH
jgi:transcriptional regulator with XRE-family HTH domain